MTIHWKDVELHFTVVLGFFFQFYPVCNFGQLDDWTIYHFRTSDLGLGTVRSERVKHFNQSKRWASKVFKCWLNYFFNELFSPYINCS